MGVKAWSVVTGVIALLALLVWSIFSGSTLATFVVLGFYALFGAALVWRVVLGARRSIPVSRTLAPGLEGLGTVQDMYLGRKEVPLVTYGDADSTVAALVVDRTDPLDDPVWKV